MNFEKICKENKGIWDYLMILENRDYLARNKNVLNECCKILCFNKNIEVLKYLIKTFPGIDYDNIYFILIDISEDLVFNMNNNILIINAIFKHEKYHMLYRVDYLNQSDIFYLLNCSHNTIINSYNPFKCLELYTILKNIVNHNIDYLKFHIDKICINYRNELCNTKINQDLLNYILFPMLGI